MELLFVGMACTETALADSDNKYYSAATVRPQQHFDFSLVEGLSQYCKVTAISEPPVASFPKSNCLWYKRESDVISEKLIISYITVVNFFGIKTVIVMANLFARVFAFCCGKLQGHRVVLVGHPSLFNSFPVMAVAWIFGVEVFLVVPDVPEYLQHYTKRGPVSAFIGRIAMKINKLIIKEFAGYIFITEHMNPLINTKQKPWMVMEGFVRSSLFESEDTYVEHDLSPRVLMYAGTIHRKFGIKKLVEAFRLANLRDCELWIYGEGDYVCDLICETVHEPRIKYKGTKSKVEILELERQATMLVNPRPSDEEFTKYSFPSKNVEYMASGRPVLTTPLPGMPKEYYDYVYLFEDESVAGMARTLEHVLSLPKCELHAKGAAAKEFVLREKNNVVQAKRIVDMIRDAGRYWRG